MKDLLFSRPAEMAQIAHLIDLAFEEDIAHGDISTQSIFPAQETATALITAKEVGVVSGIAIARMILDKMGDYSMETFAKDGDLLDKGDKVLAITAPYTTLLSCERTLLNFMQRMSGIATETRKYVLATEGTKTHILDTRKTVPGLRLLDKMAVRHGGGHNHRMGLYDMVMLKDNHIKAVGSITEAVKMVRQALPLSIKVEVETTTLQEVEEALRAGADIIMLDNMSNDLMAQAITMIDDRAAVEASGNMTIERIPSVAALGVNYISVGALTHSVKALDLSMNFVK
ncbi:carboxylating nicotinate-nucleotide diphosphorylase [Porphyromonas circumdentaria]|uniref:Probable nicotinate-nucleotide pyrophosphorylase [carboxylating] n=1 Tax=Porphyromonas circumdentaria TaxID=29524 RepID=A0A1T4N851_9PORP|nr:carboxylating nicotinate-nucleotide diphosphorylase [Porphyromonas circumdentaria]MBB6276066.1 nicotinate-nucleotide pyrophosphorylase (carboxylating) [Porphyromonas circumdentaria]SJZ75276.1 nicotinate-nucleotide pyrophosphorylase [carboxylating] [Porphyromonas circumdentaria]